MKITKFVHSCLLVETEDRVALFDPGVFSKDVLDPGALVRLDDIFITHGHPDHYDPELLQALVAKFPDARITSNPEVVAMLDKQGIAASDSPPEGVSFFEAPHENVKPVFPQPEEYGIHYLDTLSHPGDSHQFHETKVILALPITGPWGSSIKALQIALDLKPKHVVPIHDWHWSDAARTSTYDMYAEILAKEGITLHKMVTGQPIEIKV